MGLAAIIDAARTQLRDMKHPYRWLDGDLLRYVNEGVKSLVRYCPTAQIGADGAIVSYAALPVSGAFAFAESGAGTGTVSGYERLGGWAYARQETLFFSFAAGVGRIYASSAERSLGADPLASFPVAAAGSSKVSALLSGGVSSGFGGTLQILSVPAAATSWDVGVSEPSMCVQESHDEALTNYVLWRCLSEDGDDALNAARAANFQAEFLRQAKG